MHVNIVTVSSGWILQKIAERMILNNKNSEVRLTISHTPDYSADVNYYVDLQNCYHGYKTNFDVAYFTHADENSKEWLVGLFNSRNAFSLDGIVSMNKRYTDMIEDAGYPASKLDTITPGQTFDRFPLKKITIGIVSRGGYPGYGQQFMERLLESYDFKNFNLRILGDGWSELMPIAQKRNISLELLSDSNYDIYPDFYHSIDYLLIPGLWTAGPMSMQEALSCGVPVIASDVGFVNYEFKADYVFEPNNTIELIKILENIIEPRLRRRGQVDMMTWERYTKNIIEFILKLKNK